MAPPIRSSARRIIFEYQEDTFNQPEKNNNFRAMVVYDLNFARTPAGPAFWAITGSPRSGPGRPIGKTMFATARLRRRRYPVPARSTAGFSWASSSNLERRYYLGGGGQGRSPRA